MIMIRSVYIPNNYDTALYMLCLGLEIEILHTFLSHTMTWHSFEPMQYS